MPQGEPIGMTCIPGPGGRSDLQSRGLLWHLKFHCPCYPRPSLLGPIKLTVVPGMWFTYLGPRAYSGCCRFCAGRRGLEMGDLK